MEKVIDVTGTELTPGKPSECLGGDNHPESPLCCDECDYFLECYPEHQADLEEALEDLRDLKAAERAMSEYKKNPKTYTFDEVLEELGITREDLELYNDHLREENLI